ncbi:MAG: S9 family peptidase [Clostridia bacterium]|nr:S9 family peptidase [Clostridia bacterium]
MKEPFTLDRCIRMEQLSGADWLKREGLVAFASGTRGLVLRWLGRGDELSISLGRAPSFPRFSPDGRYLSFVATVPEKGRQVCLYDISTGTARPLTSIPGAAMEPIWSPDSRHLLFASSQESTDRPQPDPDEPVVIEDFHYKVDGAGFIRPDNHVQLYLCDVASGETRQLTQGTSDWMHHNFSPDGHLICACGNLHRGKEESIGFDLYVMDLRDENPEFRQISEGLIMVSYPNPVRPVFGRGGEEVIMAVLDPEAQVNGYPPAALYAFPVGGGEPRRLLDRDGECYGCVQFPYNAFCGRDMDKIQLDPETGDVYFVCGYNGTGALYRLKAGDTHAHILLGGKRVIHGLGCIQDGEMLISEGLADRPEHGLILNLRDPESGMPCLYQAGEDVLRECEIATTEDFFFDTLDHESRVHGFVMLPPGHRDGKVPGILYIHGGPHPFYTYGFTAEFQALAARGYAVLFCNPRGSSGYGDVHLNTQRSTDGSACTDLLQFVDEALRRFPQIDPDRLGATGGSYGGYMTNWLAGHTKRFRAYITQRSVASYLISYASSDMQGESAGYKNFEEFMVEQLRVSPVSYAENIDRPFLILHGEDDLRCPVEEAHQLFVAVKDTHPDLPVRLVIYPKTAHDQPRDPEMLRHYYKEMYAWFDRYL